MSYEDYYKRALEVGGGIISSCEHGWQGRYVDCYELAHICKNYDPNNPVCEGCKKDNQSCPNYKKSLTFVFASEAYWVKDRKQPDRTNCHIILAARNENGRQAINDILSEANISGYYFRPRIDLELLLSLPPDDVIITSACVAFWKYEDVEDCVVKMHSHFKNNFYLEVQYHHTDKQRELNRKVLQLAEKHNISIIMGCDSHYVYPEQWQDRENLLESKKVKYEDEEGWFLDYPSGDEAYKRFAQQGVLTHEQIMSAINNTNVFLEVEEYDCPCFNKEIKMPSLYPELSQEEKDKKYEDLVWSKWKEYEPKVEPERIPEYKKEIENEVDIVKTTKHADYFLIDYEIVQEGIRRGGVITPTGRGSGVSFFTNMLLGFTKVDRIAAQVQMYPERFMSPTRILQTKTLADLDLNLANVAPFAEAQKAVMGEEHAYPMIAFGTLKDSSAWKMYARAMKIDFQIANQVSEQIKKYEKALKHADEDDKDSIKIEKYIDPQYIDLYRESVKYKHIISDWKIAPCSYLLYAGNIRKEIGLVKIKDNLCCCMDGHWAEDYKFLKNDLLKVSVIDLIDRVYKDIGQPMDDVSTLQKKCPPGNPAWSVYERGCTMGVNQVEQSGTARRASVYSPQNISELCAFVAAIRPGFKSMYKIFESKEHFDYGIPSFDSLIQTKEMPNTFILYQEQAMKTLNYAGIPMSECYAVIKDIAKKRVSKVLAYKDTFTEGFSRIIQEKEKLDKGKADKLAEKVWQILEDSSGYSFNASHSYCVSNDSLYCAYLKSTVPLNFYRCYLEILNEDGKKDKMLAAREEAQSYFNIRFPPFRFGQDNRRISVDYNTNSITNVLSSIKGFGSSVADGLYEVSREKYDCFMDVLDALYLTGLKTSVVEPLIKIDYFSEFGNQAELSKIYALFDLFKAGYAKSISRKNVEGKYFESILSKYTTDTTKNGSIAASYTFNPNSEKYITIDKELKAKKSELRKRKKENPEQDYSDIQCEIDSLTDQLDTERKSYVMQFLRECENLIKSYQLRDVDYLTKIENQKEILGTVDLTTNKESDRKKLLVHEVYPLLSKDSKSPWAYAVIVQSIGSGKRARLTVKKEVYEKIPINEGDLILSHDLKKNAKGYWYLLRYEKIFMI